MASVHQTMKDRAGTRSAAEAAWMVGGKFEYDKKCEEEDDGCSAESLGRCSILPDIRSCNRHASVYSSLCAGWRQDTVGYGCISIWLPHSECTPFH